MSLPTPFYEADGITIYCADNRDVLPHLGKFDLLLTDPPYGLGDRMNGGTWGKSFGDTYHSWDASAPNLAAALGLAEKQIVWGGNYFGLPASRCWLAWHKPDAVPTTANVEFAWTNFDQNSRMLSQSIAATNAERCGHPTQKPLRLMVWSLQQAGHADCMIDPWAGSGTSLVAAKLRGLRGVGIEINEDYCKLAVERLRQGVLIAV